MAKLIVFGICNKKLLIPFGVVLFQILINVMNICIEEEAKNPMFEMFGVAFSELAIALIPLCKINKFKTHVIQLQKKNFKKKILNFAVLGFIFAIYVILNIYKTINLNDILKQNRSFQNPHNVDLSTFESLELIFICIVSFILLKYKYFIHHIISIVIFIISSFFIDYILGGFSDLFGMGVPFIVLSIIIVVIDAIDYGYQKYIFEFLYQPYWTVPLTLGIINFTIFGILLVLCLVKGKEESIKEENVMFISFYKYLEVVEVKIIVIKHILNILLNFVLNIFRTLMLLYFTPDFILISFTFSRIINIISDTHEYICLALFFLQFITLMFHLEILELNFCGLNRNTRRTIQEREKLEMLLQDKDNINREKTIEISPDYLIYDEDNSINDNDTVNSQYEIREQYEELNDK